MLVLPFDLPILIGCTNHPAPGQKFCSIHEQHTSPVMTPDQMWKESLHALNLQHSKFIMSGLERDNIFIVEGKYHFLESLLSLAELFRYFEKEGHRKGSDVFG